ncbi:hypothetical protein MJO29_010772 [Puccinia striiformis f. sp. tritici]|nr:hypothetical protein MJO29_010772 [Puccinia striiformis f. sp. tritici]
MELAEGIVDDIMELTENGVAAYDSGLGEEVLVTTTLLCFLADTPMHAEITSTMMPANSQNPCRACDLGVIRASQKRTMAYLQFFLQISATGSWIKNGVRSWLGIIANCYLLWQISKDPRTKTRVEKLGGQLGIKASINKQIYMYTYDIRAKKECATPANRHFLERIRLCDEEAPERLFNPFFRLPDFDGCTDTPVEILHVFLLGVVKYMVRDLMGKMKPAQLGLIEGRYRAFQKAGLNIPSLSPYYMAKHSSNFTGKEFKAVLQSAPFVLFDFMEPAERLAWIALCELAPLVFQTHIEEMGEYLRLVRFHTHKYLYYLFKITGQWVNKPKFHMLLHLADSIERFGPASLFATEKFESYNGVLRTASIHSNRQSPGKDIANTFAAYKAIRHLVCGGWFQDPKHSTRYITAAPSVGKLFLEQPLIQKTMDYNYVSHLPVKGVFPHPLNSKLSTKESVPEGLKSHLPSQQIFQHEAIQWTAHRVLKKGVSILVRSIQDNLATKHQPGCIEHLWEARYKGNVSYWVCYTEYEAGGVDSYYQMRGIRKTELKKYANIQDVVATINVQHNCHAAGCVVAATGRVVLEREESEENNNIVMHTKSTKYIVNSSELPGTTALRDWADVPRGEEEIQDLIGMLKDGLAAWVQSDGEVDTEGENELEEY